MRNFDIIALDADDTLRHNERLFSETQARFRELLTPHVGAPAIDAHLYESEKRNLKHFGYGIKGFVLSMIETAIEITNGAIDAKEIKRIIQLGRDMLDAPIELLPGVESTVIELAQSYKLMLLTKGDLFDQETKLARSGLGEHFSAIEIVSEKDEATFAAVMRRNGVTSDKFLMVGNSLKSDILPALQAGASAVHIPHELNWELDRLPEEMLEGHEFAVLERIDLLPAFLRG